MLIIICYARKKYEQHILNMNEEFPPPKRLQLITTLKQLNKYFDSIQIARLSKKQFWYYRFKEGAVFDPNENVWFKEQYDFKKGNFVIIIIRRLFVKQTSFDMAMTSNILGYTSTKLPRHVWNIIAIYVHKIEILIHSMSHVLLNRPSPSRPPRYDVRGCHVDDGHFQVLRVIK